MRINLSIYVCGAYFGRVSVKPEVCASADPVQRIDDNDLIDLVFGVGEHTRHGINTSVDVDQTIVSVSQYPVRERYCLFCFRINVSELGAQDPVL